MIAAGAIVDVDVRDDLRAGREPLRRILDAVRALPADAVLRVRATFEPVPLYAVLARKGLAHRTERLADDDWRVWFRRDEGAAAVSPAPAPAHGATAAATTEADDDDVIVLDVRDLEPPEPMARTFAALAALPPGKTLVQLNVRVPQFLLPLLAERGFVYELRPQSADLVRVFIRHRQPHGQESTMSSIDLDIRIVPPREKHPTIFRTFDSLSPGEAFTLINDHDPAPLRHQFEATRTGQYSWTYVERGPAVWKVLIAKSN